MPPADQTYPGAFRAGNSYLHQLDPRLKILLLCALMACLFSATAVWRLALLLGVWLIAAQYCDSGWREGLKVFRLLRWLLMGTLLLHLLLTPGRTLFGTSWLSYDGLLRGLLIDCQLLLAVLFSMLLAWTTSAERLAWGLTSLLAPLQWFKVPVREAGGLLILVLQFFPVIRQEVSAVREAADIPRGLSGIKAKAALVEPLLLRLVERADRFAVEMAAEVSSETAVEQQDDRRMTQFDGIFFTVTLTGIVLIWMV
jgi:energy-coupling factor transport system permease protein